MLARMSAMDSIGENPSKNENALATVKYVLAKNANDIEKLFNVAEQLIAIGKPDANIRLIGYICAQVPKDSRCGAR